MERKIRFDSLTSHFTHHLAKQRVAGKYLQGFAPFFIAFSQKAVGPMLDNFAVHTHWRCHDWQTTRHVLNELESTLPPFPWRVP